MVIKPKEIGHQEDCAGELRSNCKIQTGPLVGEGAPHQQKRKCLKIILRKEK
jgi:hypothetical protein